VTKQTIGVILHAEQIGRVTSFDFPTVNLIIKRFPMITDTTLNHYSKMLTDYFCIPVSLTVTPINLERGASIRNHVTELNFNRNHFCVATNHETIKRLDNLDTFSVKANTSEA
jgi:hypothetical protein